MYRYIHTIDYKYYWYYGCRIKYRINEELKPSVECDDAGMEYIYAITVLTYSLQVNAFISFYSTSLPFNTVLFVK